MTAIELSRSRKLRAYFEQCAARGDKSAVGAVRAVSRIVAGDLPAYMQPAKAGRKPKSAQTA